MPIRLAVSTVVPAPGTRPAHQARELSRPSKQVAEPACKPGSVVDSHSSGRTVTGALEQPTRRHRGPRHRLPIWSCSRWGLPCRPVARLAVRSYRTISPLPAPCHPKTTGPLAVSFCCTFRRLAPPRRYLAPCPVEPGLSSAPSPEGGRRGCPAGSADAIVARRRPPHSGHPGFSIVKALCRQAVLSSNAARNRPCCR